MVDAKINPAEDLKTEDQVSNSQAWPPRLMEKALYAFPLESSFRTFCINTVAPGSVFDKFILFMIIANSIVMGESIFSFCKWWAPKITPPPPFLPPPPFPMLLAITDYSEVDDEYEPLGSLPRNEIANALGPVFNFSFLLECILKVVAMGFLLGPNAYIKDSWNKLDFAVVVIR